jgi:hypothetical protein
MGWVWAGMGGLGRPMGIDRAGQAGAGLDEMPVGGPGIEFQAHYVRSGRMGQKFCQTGQAWD